MPQRFAADQHGFLVQLFPGFIFPAGVDITLKFTPRSLVDPVVGDFFDGPCMGAVDVGCIFGAVAVDVSALVDVLPDLLVARRISDALDDLRRIFPDNGAYSLPAALTVSDVDIITAVKQAGILQNTKPLFFCGRSFLYRYGFDRSNFPLDFFFCNKVSALEHPQFAAAQPCAFAEFNQFIVVRNREMFIAHAVSPAALDVLAVSLRRVEVIFIFRVYAVQLAQCFGFQLNRPCGQPLVGARLQPLVHILFCALQRRTFRVLFFNIRKKIFCVFPVRLISIERKYLLPVRTVFHSLFFAFTKGLHPGQAVIRLLVQVFIIFLVLSAQTQPPPLSVFLVEARPPPVRPHGTQHSANTLFKVLCVTALEISLRHFFTAYVCSLSFFFYGR